MKIKGKYECQKKVYKVYQVLQKEDGAEFLIYDFSYIYSDNWKWVDAKDYIPYRPFSNFVESLKMKYRVKMRKVKSVFGMI